MVFRKPRWIWMLIAVIALVITAGFALLWLPDPHQIYVFTAEQRVDEVAISPDGNVVAAAQSNRYRLAPQVSVWRVHDKEHLLSFPLNCRATVITISPDDQYLLVATGDRALGVRELETGVFVRHLLDPEPAPPGRDWCKQRSNTPDGREIYDIVFHPQGDLVAVARPDGIILLIDLRSGVLMHELQGHWDVTLEDYTAVMGVAFSPDGRLLASVGIDGSAHIWDVNNGRSIHQLQTDNPGVPFEVAFSSGSQDLFLFRQFALVEHWSLPTKTLLSRDGLPAPPDQALTFDADGTIVAVGGYEVDMNPAAMLLLEFDPRIYLCSVKHVTNCHSLYGHKDVISGLDFTADGRLLVSGSHDGTVRLWRVPQLGE